MIGLDEVHVLRVELRKLRNDEVLGRRRHGSYDPAVYVQLFCNCPRIPSFRKLGCAFIDTIDEKAVALMEI